MSEFNQYPKDLKENLLYRTAVLDEGLKDLEIAKVLRELCKRDILFFFNVFAWTYDPRSDDKDLPFITYPFQDETILQVNEAIERGEDVFIDKSRDMGLTYIVLYVFLWRWLTKKREEFRVGSRKEDYVDKSGDMDTLFEKMRYCLNKLPYFILPIGFDFKKHAPYMRMINPELNCAIIGEATNKDFARGGRKKAVLFDEFQAWEMAEEAWRSATDATPCKICVGTPQGAGTKQAELSRSDEIKNKIRLHWSRHPKKSHTSEEHLVKVINGEYYDKVGKYKVMMANDQSKAPSGCYIDQYGKIRSEWYDDECKRRNASDIAENLDIDYLTTGQPVFDTLKCLQKKSGSRPPVLVGELEWKIAPVFNEGDGFIRNFDQLDVEFVPNMNGWLEVWEKPAEEQWDNLYCISADVSEGLEQGDFDSATVLKRFGELPVSVATIHGKMRTFEFAERLAKLGIYYQKAIIAVERNNTMGGAVLEQLFKYYRYLYHKEIFTKGYATRTDKLGWETNSGTKGAIIGNLSKAISNDLFNDYDEGFWAETLTFVNNDGTLEAQSKSKGGKCFDDRVMDRAILLWINNQLPLPTIKRKQVKYTGWRSSWNNDNKNNKSLLRFTV